MSEFHINQEVVCIKSHSEGIVKEGNTYTIRGLKATDCKCKIPILIDVGIDFTEKQSFVLCVNCNTVINNDYIHWISSKLFKPLDELCNIDELTEILEKPAFA